MESGPGNQTTLIIPCSGIGKVHGLIGREATYLVTDDLARDKTATLCLALLVKGDPDAVASVQRHACITIDGCAKACAQKNVELAGGRVAKAIQVAEAFRNFRGAKPGTATALTDDGWMITREIAKSVTCEAASLHDIEGEVQ
ncbi:MAG: putative zinc-binding protein [Terracidiphilus sp.]